MGNNLEHLMELGQETEEELLYVLAKSLIAVYKVANFKELAANAKQRKQERASMSSLDRSIIDIGTRDRSRCL